MVKSNEYVGVDEKYIPEGEQRKTHVQEPIIGSENTQKIRDGITGGVNKLASDEGKEKIKTGAKKGWKVVKGVVIARLVFTCIAFLLTITIIVVIIVNIIKDQATEDEFMDDFNEASSSMVEEYNKSKNEMQDEYENAKNEAMSQYKNATGDNLDLHSGVNWRTYVSDDLEEIYTNNKAGEHLITVINGSVSTTNPQQIRALANSIENESMSKKYDISIEYGDDGYVKTYTFEEF